MIIIPYFIFLRNASERLKSGFQPEKTTFEQTLFSS